MDELPIKEEPIPAETTETTSFCISDDDDGIDSDIVYNNKLTLLDISLEYSLSNIVTNMVLQYLSLMEYAIEHGKYPSFLSAKLPDFYYELPFSHILHKFELKK